MKCPKWCSQAVPTLRGWADPKTGELFVSKRFTQEQIDEYNGVSLVTEEVVVEEPQLLQEAPVNKKSLEDMTKVELQAIAEQSGVQVSKRATKKTLLERLMLK